MRSAELWTFAFQKPDTGGNGILNRFRITLELRHKSVNEYDCPIHTWNIV